MTKDLWATLWWESNDPWPRAIHASQQIKTFQGTTSWQFELWVSVLGLRKLLQTFGGLQHLRLCWIRLDYLRLFQIIFLVGSL